MGENRLPRHWFSRQWFLLEKSQRRMQKGRETKVWTYVMKNGRKNCRNPKILPQDSFRHPCSAERCLKFAFSPGSLFHQHTVYLLEMCLVQGASHLFRVISQQFHQRTERVKQGDSLSSQAANGRDIGGLDLKYSDSHWPKCSVSRTVEDKEQLNVVFAGTRMKPLRQYGDGPI